MAEQHSPAASASTPAAILFIPGIFGVGDGDGLDGVARRLARVLDHQDRHGSNAYEARPAPSEPLAGDSSLVAVQEILRTSPDGTSVVTHRVYGLDYLPALEAGSSERNLITRTFAVAHVWAWMFLRFIANGVRALSLGRSQKAAATVGAAAFLLLTGYLVILLLAVAKYVTSGVTTSPAVSAAFEPFEPALTSAQPFILILGCVGVTFAAIRERIESLVSMFLRFNRYIASGLGRAGSVGRFNDLLEHVAEAPGGPPCRIDVIAYSMGTVVALDSLFPTNGTPLPRLTHVATLTTIGCPFDFIRTFWPAYFEDRALPERRPRWINVYSPVDLLGSNFTNSSGVAQSADHGINFAQTRGEPSAPRPSGSLCPSSNTFYDHANRKNLGFWGALFGSAYSAHSQYWVVGDPRAESCYGLVVPEIVGT